MFQATNSTSVIAYLLILHFIVKPCGSTCTIKKASSLNEYRRVTGCAHEALADRRDRNRTGSKVLAIMVI